MKEQLTFTQISQALDISEEEILYFNPQYRKNIIPSGGNTMCLPKNKIAYFLNNEIAIYDAVKEQMRADHQYEIVEVKHYHTVRMGERLSAIARKYGISVEDLKTWNDLGNKGAKSGRKLLVYVKEQRALPPPPLSIASVTKPDTIKKLLAENRNAGDGYQYHVVEKGETIFSLARQFNVEPQTIINENSLSERTLYIGQTLKIKNKEE